MELDCNCHFYSSRHSTGARVRSFAGREIAQGRMDVPELANNEKSPRSVDDILELSLQAKKQWLVDD